MTGRRRGRADQAARARLAPIVAAGLAECGRCGLRILPEQQWDAGHAHDIGRGGDPAGPLRPEHALKRDCPAGGNRSAGGVLGRQLRTGQQLGRRRSLATWLRFFWRHPAPGHSCVPVFPPAHMRIRTV